MTLTVSYSDGSYPVHVQNGGLSRLTELFPLLGRRVLLVTDSGVPDAYVRSVLSLLPDAVPVVLPAGEDSKSPENWLLLLRALSAHGFTRSDCVVALGGGMAGDLAGFAAACYMRGIDCFLCPTTLLAQVDASVGGKTAFNLDGLKNAVGAFHQPRGVLADPSLLATLPARQYASGMAEVIKMAATSDAALFAALEAGIPRGREAELVAQAIRIKQAVVEQDEKEGGLRRVLNFGHTVGHAIESAEGGTLLHGECVALGMLPLCGEEVRRRLCALYRQYGLPSVYHGDRRALLAALLHDKKAGRDGLTVVTVPAVGSFRFREISFADAEALLHDMISEDAL